MSQHLTPEQIQLLIARIPELPLSEKVALLEQIEASEVASARAAARTDFLIFCHRVYPGFKEGPHHRHLKPLLHDMARDDYDHRKNKAPTHAKRMTVSMAPRMGKSETIAYLYVAWYLGHNPSHQIIMGTHTEELSSGFGRKVRDLLDTAEYRAIFPETQVSKDKSAAGNWTTTAKGVYLALGINSSAAGKGAHLFVADDLVSEQAVLANPDEAFEKAWTFLQVGPLQRLMPGGRIIMIGCMTAETRVLMADGSEKELQHIEVGDAIATYDAGKIATSRVTNWIKHHSDFVYKIKTTSGRIVRANERHPFLVDRDGGRTWVRVRDLKVGDCLVEAAPPADVCAPSKQKGCASCVTDVCCVPKGGLAVAERANGENGAGWSALLPAAVSPSSVRGFVTAAMARLRGVLGSIASRKRRNALATSNTGTDFLQRSTTHCMLRKGGAAPSAGGPLPQKTQGPAASRSYTSTTATTPRASGDCSATTATLRSVTPEQKACCLPLPSTYVATTAAIVEIVKDGFEPVFDMEVARTENFIANGVVSHNTRWGRKDPIGRAVQWARENEDALPWHEIKFPAVMEVEREGVPTLVSLWPEQWPLEELLAKKSGMQPQFWNAQYLQEPTNEEGSIIKREWWHIWPHDEPPECEFTIQTWDTAHDTKSTNDYSACQTWGVFFLESEQRYALILLNAFHKRMEFPDLKARAKQEHEEWKPDALVIEKKAAGAPLIQELRRMGLFIEEVSPSRGTNLVSKDKRARLNAIAPVFQDGAVWVPDKRWAREVIELCAEFPNGEFDDPVDCVEMAVSRFRRGNFVRLTTDDNSDNDADAPRTLDYY